MSAMSFNCSSTCKGIYADVQLIGRKIEETDEFIGKNNNEEVDEESNKLLKRLADLEKEMKLLKIGGGERGEEQDKEKYKMLVAEYRKFKTSNVKHFRFNAVGISSAFGTFTIQIFC